MSKDGARAALTALCELFAPGDVALSAEVLLAFDDPPGYLERFRARLEERGIDTTIPDLPAIALLDALSARERLRSIDWKFAAEDIKWNLDRVLTTLGLDAAALLAWYDDGAFLEVETTWFLKKAGYALAAHGYAVVSIDHGADEHPITVIPFDRVAEAKALAKRLGLANIKVVSFSPAKRPAKPLKAAKPKPARVDDAWTAPAGTKAYDDECNGPGFIKIGRDALRLIELTTWPPTASVLSPGYATRVAYHATSGARVVDGTSHVPETGLRRGALTLHRLGEPARSLEHALPDSILIERLGFIGDALVVLPTESTYRLRARTGTEGADRPWILEPSEPSFHPIDELPAAVVPPAEPGSFPLFLRNGRARTGDGVDVLVWEGRGYERREAPVQHRTGARPRLRLGQARFAEAFDLGPSGAGAKFLATPARGDGFYFIVDRRVREARRGVPFATRLPELPEAYDLCAGKGSFVIARLVRRKSNDPCLALFDPDARRYTLVPPTTFGLKGDDDVSFVRFAAATDRVCMLYEGEVRSVQWSIAAGAAWLDEQTGRRAKG